MCGKESKKFHQLTTTKLTSEEVGNKEKKKIEQTVGSSQVARAQ